MSIAIAQEFDTAEVLAPEQPLTIAGHRAVAPTRSRRSSSSRCTAAKRAAWIWPTGIRLPYSILEPLLEHLRVELLVQVKSAAGIGTAGYRYTLTDAGRDRALRYFEACGYVGPAPVPIAQYTTRT